MTVSLANIAKNAEADATAALLDGGKVKLYSGTVPANANTILTLQVLAATLTFASPAGSAAASGVFTADALLPDTDAAGSAAAVTFFRACKADDTVVFQGSVTGISGGGDLEIGETTIDAGDTVTCTSFAYARP